MSDKRHTGRNASGRYASTVKCDCCGKGIASDNYCSDDAVCQGGDGPGFYLCERKRCVARYAGLDVAARRALFTAGRAANGQG